MLLLLKLIEPFVTETTSFAQPTDNFEAIIGGRFSAAEIGVEPSYFNCGKVS